MILLHNVVIPRFSRGINVTAMMVITTIMAALLSFYSWRWGLFRVLAIFVPLLIIDLSLLAATLRKLPDGGWFAVLFAAVFYLIFALWHRYISLHDVHTVLK